MKTRGTYLVVGGVVVVVNIRWIRPTVSDLWRPLPVSLCPCHHLSAAATLVTMGFM